MAPTVSPLISYAETRNTSGLARPWVGCGQQQEQWEQFHLNLGVRTAGPLAVGSLLNSKAKESSWVSLSSMLDIFHSLPFLPLLSAMGGCPVWHTAWFSLVFSVLSGFGQRGASLGDQWEDRGEGDCNSLPWGLLQVGCVSGPKATAPFYWPSSYDTCSRFWELLFPSLLQDSGYLEAPAITCLRVFH